MASTDSSAKSTNSAAASVRTDMLTCVTKSCPHKRFSLCIFAANFPCANAHVHDQSVVDNTGEDKYMFLAADGQQRGPIAIKILR